MKRILHVIEGMNAGGMETMIMNYYRNIDRNKFQFDFLINCKEPVFYEKEINRLGGHIYRNTLPKHNIFKNRLEIRKLFKNKKYDVIHCHQGITYYYPLKAAKKYKIKTRIIHNHGINRTFLKCLFLYNQLWARKRISSLGNKYISCSKDVLDHIFSDDIIRNHKYIILPNAIDIENFKYKESARKKIRKEFNIDDEIVFVHVGTFTTPKNHSFLLDVFKKYSMINKNAKLLLVGSGPLKQDIINKAKELNILSNLIFAGVRSDVNDILSACDIMLFPSLYESFGIVALEAQAAGLPVIISDQFPKDILLTDSINMTPLDVDLWVKKIKNTKLNIDRKNYNSILCNSDFNIKNSVKILEKIYSEEDI